MTKKSIEALRSALADWDENGGLVLYLWPLLDAARAVVADHDAEVKERS